MINRRSFIQLVRNRIAAGVLCSGMLTDALERTAFPLAEIYPSTIPMTATQILAQLNEHNRLSNLRFYGVGIAQQMDEFSREVAEVARQRMDEASDGL